VAAEADGIERADRADATVALEDAIAEIARARAETPLMHASEQNVRWRPLIAPLHQRHMVEV